MSRSSSKLVWEKTEGPEEERIGGSSSGRVSMGLEGSPLMDQGGWWATQPFPKRVRVQNTLQNQRAAAGKGPDE